MLSISGLLWNYDAMPQNKASLNYLAASAGLIKTQAMTHKHLCLQNGLGHSPTRTLKLLLPNRIGRDFPDVELILVKKKKWWWYWKEGFRELVQEEEKVKWLTRREKEVQQLNSRCKLKHPLGSARIWKLLKMTAVNVSRASVYKEMVEPRYLCDGNRFSISRTMCVCSLGSVMSAPLRPHGLYIARLLCPWDFPAKNTAVGCHFLLQGIFPAQGWNPSLLHWKVDSLPLTHQESPF